MTHNNEYNFTLVLSGVNENTEGLEDALFNAGCDDALVTYKNGIVCLEFDREAASLQEAIISAIKAIESTELGATIDHIEGAFVTISDFAKRMGLSKQSVSLLARGKRGPGNFPIPFTRINSASPLWRLKDIVTWYLENKKLKQQEVKHFKLLRDEAELIDKVNGALELRDKHVVASRKAVLKDLDQKRIR